jgi:hypothetical protein
MKTRSAELYSACCNDRSRRRRVQLEAPGKRRAYLTANARTVHGGAPGARSCTPRAATIEAVDVECNSTLRENAVHTSPPTPEPSHGGAPGARSCTPRTATIEAETSSATRRFGKTPCIPHRQRPNRARRCARSAELYSACCQTRCDALPLRRARQSLTKRRVQLDAPGKRRASPTANAPTLHGGAPGARSCTPRAATIEAETSSATRRSGKTPCIAHRQRPNRARRCPPERGVALRGLQRSKP